MNKLSHALLLDEIATALKRPTPDNRTDRELGTNLLSLIATRLSDVTPEMVEAAAEAICALHEDLERTPWSEWADSVRDRYRTDARAALSVIPEAAEWEADAARYRGSDRAILTRPMLAGFSSAAFRKIQ
jgi:hypothetical protein